MNEAKVQNFMRKLEKDREEALGQEEFFKGKGLPDVLVARRNHRAYIEGLIEDLAKALAPEDPTKPEVQKKKLEDGKLEIRRFRIRTGPR